MKRIILTGAPGAGKTIILRALEAAGHAVVEEAATDVIALEQARGVSEPHTDQSFIERIARLQIARQRRADAFEAAVVFFDRSPVCTFALAEHLGYAPPRMLFEEIARIARHNIYDRRVIFVETLGFIRNTEARRISHEESLRFAATHEAAYARFGYKLARIAPGSVDERVAAVLRAME